MITREQFDRVAEIAGPKSYISVDVGFKKSTFFEEPKEEVCIYALDFSGSGATFDEAFSDWKIKLGDQRKARIASLEKELEQLKGVA